MEQPIHRTVEDPIDYRSPGRFAHRESGCSLFNTNTDPSPTPRSLPSMPSPNTLNSQFPFSPAEPQHIFIPTPTTPTTLTQRAAIPRDRGEAGHDGSEVASSRCGFTVLSSGSSTHVLFCIVTLPSFIYPDTNEMSIRANLLTTTTQQPHIHLRSTRGLYIELPFNAVMDPTLSSPPFPRHTHQPQIQHDEIHGGCPMRRPWEEFDTPSRLLQEDYDPDQSDLSTDLEDGITTGLSPHPPEKSATESPTTASSSFSNVNSSRIEHQIKEDTSITKADLNELFPPSSLRPASSHNSTSSNKWICQHADCGKLIRGQDKRAHMLEHRGLKRFTCSW